ncbi:MAG: molybdenum cofactor cytidylyltransferase [Blastocatellia bacterium]|jgi:CTP:molybdopterin cytidylyltransferase MocA|nr:molybdenum cofactor cytidylyltransferase [Blastocatellia bacterium]
MMLEERQMKTTDDGRRATGVAAVLLAAGRSRRMGAFKPLLPFGPQTVVEACIEHLLKGGAESIVVVVGHRAGEMRERLAGRRVTFAVNDEEGSEMSASIARGVECVDEGAGAMLVALCDQPAIPPAVVSLLIEEWRRTGAALLAPEFEGRGGHPVLIDLRFREELRRLDPLRGLRSLFDAHRVEARRVPVASPFVARDMDTWQDYVRLHSEVFGAEPPCGADYPVKRRET